MLQNEKFLEGSDGFRDQGGHQERLKVNYIAANRVICEEDEEFFNSCSLLLPRDTRKVSCRDTRDITI